MPVSERREQVLDMRAQGLTNGQIAERLGLSKSWVAHLASERSYITSTRLSAEAKRRRHGSCERCGAPTNYNGNGRALSRLCRSCGVEWSRERSHAVRGTGAMNSRVVEFLSEPRRFMEIANEFQITTGYASSMLDRLLKYGLVRRQSRGIYVRT